MLDNKYNKNIDGTKDDKKKETVLQFVKFGIVGASNTVISYLLYLLFLYFFIKAEMSPKYDYLVAQFFSFSCSVFWSFFWNKRFVFKKGNSEICIWKALCKTYLAYAFTGIFLNSILSAIWVLYCNIDKEFAPLINLIITVPLNFLLNKFWAFSSRKNNL